MFETSLHPVHPFLSPYISTFATMNLKQDEPFNAIFTAKPDSVLMFNIGHGRSGKSIDFEFTNQPEKTLEFNNDQAWFGGLLTKPLTSQIQARIHVL
jgi:hypothetical protein